jgi:hypothetical protein
MPDVRLRKPALLVLLLLAAACAAGCDARRGEVDAASARHAAELAQLQRAQADLAARTPVPARLACGAAGTLVVHECALEGRPGREVLRVRFTWVNTTGHAVDAVRVRLVVRDPSSGDERAAASALCLPLRVPFGPDSSDTATLEVPTGGLHLRPGWTWDLSAARTGAAPATE